MQFLSYILNGIWSIAPEHQAAYKMSLAKLLLGEVVSSPEETRLARQLSMPGFASSTGTGYEMTNAYVWPVGDLDAFNLDKLPKGSVAIMPFTDAIMKYDQACGPEGVTTKMRGMMKADRHDNIKAHIVKIDSGGGEAMAMFNTQDFLKALKKPVVAFVDDLSASAAYGIATGATYIVANRAEAQIGSIGTMCTVVDDTGYFEQKGFKLTDVYADASVDKNGWYRAALEGNMEPLKAELNKFNEKFLSLVETNRAGKLTADRKTWGTGKVFGADEALTLGLIDDIGSFDQTIQSLLNS